MSFLPLCLSRHIGVFRHRYNWNNWNNQSMNWDNPQCSFRFLYHEDSDVIFFEAFHGNDFGEWRDDIQVTILLLLFCIVLECIVHYWCNNSYHAYWNKTGNLSSSCSHNKMCSPDNRRDLEKNSTDNSYLHPQSDNSILNRRIDKNRYNFLIHFIDNRRGDFHQ